MTVPSVTHLAGEKNSNYKLPLQIVYWLSQHLFSQQSCMRVCGRPRYILPAPVWAWWLGRLSL